MSQKQIGFVELEWVCPSCQARNPGSVRVCANCGSPQPDNVQFQQKEQGADVLTDEKKIAAAASGADIHCPYCGTRNPATAKVCSQCNGDLVDGKKREAGKVVGAGVAVKPLAPINCPSCGTSNPGARMTCLSCGALLHGTPAPNVAKQQPASANTVASASPFLMAGGVLLGLCVLAVCVFSAFMLLRTEDKKGTVQGVNWACEVEVLALRDVEKEDWKDEIPQKGKVLSCDQRVRKTVEQQVPNSREVCGTPYDVDLGNGNAKRVQDCQYEVYDDYCSYTVQEWKVIKTLDTRGSDYKPVCKDVAQGGAERKGETHLEFHIKFETDSGILDYSTSDKQLYQQFQPGTVWTLKVNQLGQVVDVER